MRRLGVLGIALFVLGLVVAAHGQVGQILSPGLAPPASVGYQGPLDLLSGSIGWWGLRAGSNAKATAAANLAIITRASDSTTCTVVANATSGSLDLAATSCASSTTIATWCNATTCRVTTLYDQSSGGHNLTLGSVGSTLTFNCINTSLPCMTFVANTNFLTTGAVLGTVSQPYMYSMVAQRTGSFTTRQTVVGSTGALSFHATANNWEMSSGATLTFAATDSAWHAAQAYFTGSSSFANLDGTETGGNPSTQASGTSFVFGGGAAGMIGGLLTEGGLWTGSTTMAQRNAVCHNQRIYWAISGSTC